MRQARRGQVPGSGPPRVTRARNRHGDANVAAVADEVEVRDLPETRVAYMRYVGPYGAPGVTDLWQRFRSWCAAANLTPASQRMFGIAQDNPNITSPERTRYDACVEVRADFQPEPGDDIGVQTLRGARHAFVPFTGTAAEIRAAWIRFLTKTLPDAGLEPDLLPAIEIYPSDLAVDPRTGVFSCTLCIPIRGA
jgi:AraC family transcriptional regulator